MTVSAEHASEHFAELLSAADRGEAVIITRPDKFAVAMSVAKPTEKPDLAAIAKSRAELFGSWKGKIWMAPDWDSPEANAEITAEFLDEDDEKGLFRAPSNE